eukprot:m.26704 g.26704  ORF g.26704 m.26704 type:complete len:622 (+) comp11832_c0_seq2:743-2608(+)
MDGHCILRVTHPAARLFNCDYGARITFAKRGERYWWSVLPSRYCLRSGAAGGLCGVDQRSRVPSAVPGQPPIDSSASLTAALEAAAKAGGGTVYFPRGQYFLRGSFDVAANTYLKGEGQDLVALYWAEANVTNHPTYLFRGQSGSPAIWGLADLSIYTTAYYYNIIIDGLGSCNTKASPWGCERMINLFTMLRIRIRANAYFASSAGPYSAGNRFRPNVNFNFSANQVQGVVMLTGTNWRVTDCDILGTGGIFWSGGSDGGYGGTSYGQLSRNVVHNGGSAFEMDQWKQVVVEDNEVTGAALSSFGNNIATYNGGYAQHIAMLNNSIAQVWGGDREVMTYDNAGGAYFGVLESVDGVTVTAGGDRIPLNRYGTNNSATGGGWVVTGGALIVLNGTGAGQVRRIVESVGSRGWVLDLPLDAVDLVANGSRRPSFVQILPYRGRNIFHRNFLSDCGAFQFYGIGLENVVSENRNERMAGMVSWGQWREWHSPAEGGVGGEMGCGANPNLFNVFERNEFIEGNTIVNYNTPEGASYNWGAGYVLASASGKITGGSGRFEDLSMNAFTVFRQNIIRSNGGILVDNDAENVLVEGNIILQSDLQICVTNLTRSVVLIGNSARAVCV